MDANENITAIKWPRKSGWLKEPESLDEKSKIQSLCKQTSFKETLEAFENKSRARKKGPKGTPIKNIKSDDDSPLKEKVDSFEKFSKHKKKILGRPPKYTSPKGTTNGAKVQKACGESKTKSDSSGSKEMKRRDSSSSLSRWISMPTLKEEEVSMDMPGDGKVSGDKPHWTAVFSSRLSQIRQRFEHRCSVEKARAAQQGKGKLAGKAVGAGERLANNSNSSSNNNKASAKCSISCLTPKIGRKNDNVQVAADVDAAENSAGKSVTTADENVEIGSSFGSHILEWENKWDSLTRKKSPHGSSGGDSGAAKPLTPVPWRKARPLSYAGAGEMDVYQQAGYGNQMDAEKDGEKGGRGGEQKDGKITDGEKNGKAKDGEKNGKIDEEKKGGVNDGEKNGVEDESSKNNPKLNGTNGGLPPSPKLQSYRPHNSPKVVHPPEKVVAKGVNSQPAKQSVSQTNTQPSGQTNGQPSSQSAKQSATNNVETTVQVSKLSTNLSTQPSSQTTSQTTSSAPPAKPLSLPPSASGSSLASSSGAPTNTSLTRSLSTIDPMTKDSMGFTSEDYIQERVTLKNWDPTLLLQDLYKIELQPENCAQSSYLNMEGYMEKLPINKKKATLLKTWKRRYFRARDGSIYYYENAADADDSTNLDLASEHVEKSSGFLPLMGGKIEELGERMLGIDDGRGNYLLVRAPSDADAEKWRQALQSQTGGNPGAAYVKPVLSAPPHPHKNVLVIDLGSASIRAGILGDQPSLPQVFFPCVVATDKTTGHKTFGFEALKSSVRHNSTFSYPIRPTSKVDKFSIEMSVMTGLFDHIFSQLQVKPANYWVMLSTPATLSDKVKEKFMDMLINHYQVQGVNMISQTMLALYAYGATSGVVVDIGERIEILPITDGYIVEGGSYRQSYGGHKVMEILNTTFTEKKYRFFTDVEFLIVRLAMEKLCFVSDDYESDVSRCAEKPDEYRESISLEGYDLPQGSWTHVSNDAGRFKAPEGLFQQEVWEMDDPPLPRLVQKAVQACPMDARRGMWRCVYLAGGVTLIPGFVERLQRELAKIAPSSITVQVHAAPQRYHAAFVGACALASMAVFQQACISAEEWRKHGAPALRKWHMY